MHADSWLWCRTISALPRIALLLASVCIAYFFLSPPPFAAFSWFESDPHILRSSPQAPLSRSPSIPNASLGASVVYRDAPWKSHAGRWLSRCHRNAHSLPIHEPIFNYSCPEECNYRGVCNHEDGQCRCFYGYNGPSCKHISNLQCNLKASTVWPYGRWVVSICPAECDKTKSMCFCGSGTKYPNRPVAEACGFKLNGTVVDWANQDWDIFTNVSTKQGWCNVDPIDWYHGNVKVKEQCDCTYDCTAGRLCEIATQCVCINQCSQNGICRGGICQCNKGWYGIDCSMPSPLMSRTEWPKWLSSEAHSVDLIESPVVDMSFSQSSTVVVKKKHPLIYIYDLPPEFNSHLLEGRHWKFLCVNRVYNQDNATIWAQQLYGAEIALYESLLHSPHRTLNAKEADFFYVPVLGACLIARADETPDLSMKNFRGLRSYTALDLYRRAYLHISQSYPYWNQTAGRDHIWFFSWDEGACFAPKEIWNSMMLVHWGNTNTKYNYSTTGYLADNWSLIPLSERGNHTCFDPQKDLVLPAWKLPSPSLVTARFWERPRSKRKTLFYFNGNLGNAYEYGRPEQRYSMGLRQKLAKEFGSSPDKNGMLGKQATNDVIVTSIRSNQYSLKLASSKFCGVLPGDGWSGRMEDSILHGCIPVIIQGERDGTALTGRKQSKAKRACSARDASRDGAQGRPGAQQGSRAGASCRAGQGDGAGKAQQGDARQRRSRAMQKSRVSRAQFFTQDGIQLIYENVLEYSEFTVRIREEEIPQLVNILRAVNETELDRKFNAIQRLWQRFVYRDSILLEAQRQEKEFGKISDWARAFSTLEDDDALSTFLQILHYKLYNDDWRLHNLKQRPKRDSLPQDCLGM